MVRKSCSGAPNTHTQRHNQPGRQFSSAGRVHAQQPGNCTLRGVSNKHTHTMHQEAHKPRSYLYPVLTANKGRQPKLKVKQEQELRGDERGAGDHVPGLDQR